MPKSTWASSTYSICRHGDESNALNLALAFLASSSGVRWWFLRSRFSCGDGKKKTQTCLLSRQSDIVEQKCSQSLVSSIKQISWKIMTKRVRSLRKRRLGVAFLCCTWKSEKTFDAKSDHGLTQTRLACLEYANKNLCSALMRSWFMWQACRDGY